MALWCGSCARPGIIVPAKAVPVKMPECDIPQLQAELARCENELTRDNGERTNYLTRVARLSFLLGELSPNQEKQYYFEKGRP